MDLSVIIVSYNVSGYLKECLKSVSIAAKNIDSEILVVDNNSADDSCEMVSREFPGVILIRNKTNVGYAKANNQALRISQGKYVLLLNPDTLVMSDTFIKCIDFMELHND
ncbi:MAG: glycosyltransferase [Bacteroidia bacterium]|nr:glycosyltransferase [Bacteroidia bacterium]